MSPRFVEIYHQAESAEQFGLTELCGVGYRKALEFLVKDFAISYYPGESEKIRALQLSPCISSYIDNQQLKDLARASAWIGNDETHYTRKHEDYNLEHLKTYIDAIVSYITFNLTAQEAQELLSKPK
jgi:hypothetical protein